MGGVLPIAGDAFDVVWRSNKRNLNLIEKYKGDTAAKPSALDYGIVVGGVLLAIASIVLPIFMFYGVGAGLLWALFG